MKVMKILAETEGNSCSHEIIDAPYGGLWPLVRKEAADYCSAYADPRDCEANAFAKKVETELIMFGTYDMDRFHAAYGKSAFGTPYVTLEIDPDEDDVFMRFNLTYIVLPKEFDDGIKPDTADEHEALKFKADISQGGNISLLVWKNGADFFRSVRTGFDGFEIELVRSDGSRVFQAYPEDGDAAARNAVAMLEGICEETGDELLLTVAKRLIAKIRREQERR